MPTRGSSQGLTRTLFSMFQSGGAYLLNNERLHPDVLVHEIRAQLLSRYNGVKDAVSRYIPYSTPGTSITESIDLESQIAHDQGVNTIQRSEETLVTILHNHGNPFTSEGNSPVEEVQLAESGGHSSLEAPLARTRHTWMWVVALIVVVLFLIMAPGLIVGLVTRQVAWGIAISGVFAPAIVFFGGLYYHHNK